MKKTYLVSATIFAKAKDDTTKMKEDRIVNFVMRTKSSNPDKAAINKIRQKYKVKKSRILPDKVEKIQSI